MKNRRIIAGTVLAASALCWALWGGTAKVDTVPAAAAESAVSAPCAPRTQPTEPINKIDISEPITESETILVAGSVASPALECPQETPMVVPASTTAEEPIAEQSAAIPEPAPTEEPTMQPTAETPQGDMIYVPGFGYLQSEGPGEWSVSENMYENGNKVGSMG
ncbi:MAG: hypothetical protein Q3995_06005 [Eubacteriales bacterium]|nr:hypothetical protein [Eubacteriales bacterium]